MLTSILAGGTVLAVVPTRAQLPLLLAQAPNLSTVAVGQATETDTALPIAVALGGAAVVQVGIASETDSAFPVTIVIPPDHQFVPVGQASETDTALAVTFITSGDVFVVIGQATETDEAFPLSFNRDLIFPHDDRDLSLTAHADADLTITPVEVA